MAIGALDTNPNRFVELNTISLYVDRVLDLSSSSSPLSLTISGTAKNHVSLLSNDTKIAAGVWNKEHHTFTPVIYVFSSSKYLLILGWQWPFNILRLAGPDYVAKITGRRGMLVRASSGKGVTYQARNTKDLTMEMVNMHEKQLFMDGKKLVAIIFEAAGSAGVSLQADKRDLNQKGGSM